MVFRSALGPPHFFILELGPKCPKFRATIVIQRESTFAKRILRRRFNHQFVHRELASQPGLSGRGPASHSVQVGAFLALSVGLFVVFSCALYFNVTLHPRYRPHNWIVAGSILSAVILLLCAIGGGVGLFRKLLAE